MNTSNGRSFHISQTQSNKCSMQSRKRPESTTIPRAPLLPKRKEPRHPSLTRGALSPFGCCLSFSSGRFTNPLHGALCVPRDAFLRRSWSTEQSARPPRTATSTNLSRSLKNWFLMDNHSHDFLHKLWNRPIHPSHTLQNALGVRSCERRNRSSTVPC